MSPNIGVKTMMVVLLLHVSVAYPKRKAVDNIDISNYIIAEDSVEDSARFSKILKPISEQNSVPQDVNSHFNPSEIIEKTRLSIIRDNYDPYFLSNIILQVPSEVFKTAQFHEVLLKRGRLFGMSDFRRLVDDKLSKDSSNLYLLWNRLRTMYTVTVEKDGLRDTGEIEVLARRFIMRVQMPLSFPKEPKVDVSEVTGLETKMNGLDIESKEFRTAVISDFESRIRNILNTKIRFILQNYVKKSFDNNSLDNDLSPFML